MDVSRVLDILLLQLNIVLIRPETSTCLGFNASIRIGSSFQCVMWTSVFCILSVFCTLLSLQNSNLISIYPYQELATFNCQSTPSHFLPLFSPFSALGGTIVLPYSRKFDAITFLQLAIISPHPPTSRRSMTIVLNRRQSISVFFLILPAVECSSL